MNRHHPFVAALLCAAAILLAALPAQATQSPSPQEYSLTVNRSGGSDCTYVRIYSPATTDWTHTSVTRSYPSGTTVVIEITEDCPCGYVFSKWQSADGQVNNETDTEVEFQVSQDMTATAIFVPRTGKLTVYVIDRTPNSSNPHPTWDLYGVGHSFWLLEGDCIAGEIGPYVNQAWGYWPEGALFEGSSSKTFISAPGFLKNDTELIEDATDSRTYDITWSQLVAAAQYTKSLHDSPPAYHLATHNCTDALINVAAAAGVTLPNAVGTCPGACISHNFTGDCPGALGETLNP